MAGASFLRGGWAPLVGALFFATLVGADAIRDGSLSNTATKANEWAHRGKMRRALFSGNDGSTKEHPVDGVAMIWCVLKFAVVPIWFAVVILNLNGNKSPQYDLFCDYEIKTRELHNKQIKKYIHKFTLCFLDPEEEVRFCESYAQKLCDRMKPLCYGLIVFVVYNATWSEDKSGSVVFNPGLTMSLSSSAALVYTWATVTLVVLALALLYFVNFRPDFKHSKNLELMMVLWLLTVLFLSSALFSRWFVSKIHGEDPAKVFLSYGFDEEFTDMLILLVLYLTLFTPLRFVALVPFGATIPLVYIALILLFGSPEGEHKQAYANKDAQTEDDVMQLKHEWVTSECTAMLVGIVMALLAGRWFDETRKRVIFWKTHTAFMLEQELTDQRTVGFTPITQARTALAHAVETLEVIQNTPGVDSLIGRQLHMIQDRVDFVKTTLQRPDLLFETNADEAVITCVGADRETKQYLKEAFFTDVATKAAKKFMGRRRASTAQSRMSVESRTNRKTINSVKVRTAVELAGGWGKDWHFDSLELARKTGNCACIYAGERALVEGPSVDDSLAPRCLLGVGKECLRTWVRTVHCRYLPNSYHNEAHASQVSHVCMYLAHITGWVELADAVQLCALLMAAFTHDVGHFARNNLFCLKAWNTVSTMWNDKSVLENMHAALCFSLTSGEADILECLDCTARSRLKAIVVRFILATDIKEHHNTLARLHAAMDDKKFLKRPSPGDAEQEFDKFEEQVNMAGEVIMKTADISHGFFQWEQHKEWSYRVLVEFFEQGDEECELGMALSPLCDRYDCMIASSQGFFIGHFGKGMLDNVGRIMSKGAAGHKGELKVLSDLADENIQKWKEEETHVNPTTINLNSLLTKFGSYSNEVIYPYPYEKGQVLKPMTLSESLNRLATFERSNYCDPAATLADMNPSPSRRNIAAANLSNDAAAVRSNSAGALRSNTAEGDKTPTEGG